MTRREIFFIVSIACFGIFILIGAYLWRGNAVYSKEIDINKEIYTKQAEELQKEEKAAKVSQANPVKTQSANPVGATANPPAAVNPTPAVTPGNVYNTPSNPAPPAAAKSSSSFIAPGCRVGDVVKLGDVEMIVTKSTARHKVIDITLKGNTSDQPPRLIRTENNRIIYEIPADVDVNVDVTEKTTIDKSPLFYGEQKAGK